MTIRRANRPGDLLRRVCSSFTAEVAAHSCGLTLQQHGILDALLRLGPKRVAEICTATGLDRTSAHSQIVKLVEAGRCTGVEVSTGSPGPRPLLITITPFGRKALHDADVPLYRAEQAFLKPLKPRERMAFLKFLSVLVNEARP